MNVLVGCGSWRGPDAPRLDPVDAVSQLTRVLAEIEDGYVEPVTSEKLMTGAIRGMVAELDPHSSYMTPEEFVQFRDDTEGKLVGIGVEIDLHGDALTVVVPIEGGPAEAAGVQSGDKIIAIDGRDVDTGPLDKVVRKMRGAEGTHVRITVKRSGAPAPISFDLTRRAIHLTAVVSRLLDGAVGYVRIKQFQEGAAKEFARTVEALRQEAKTPLSGLILDLRSNPGGLVNEAASIASEFIAKGTIYTARRRGEIIDSVEASEGGGILSTPAVVLVDEWSASASELVAGALQDHHRARIVGMPTFGKGSVQAIIPLAGGAGMRMTIARYYTPSGRSVQSEGILPDVKVPSVRSADGIHVVRERDLEGHLVGDREADAGTTAQDDDALGIVPLRVDVSKMPSDPRLGGDAALRAAYEMLAVAATSSSPH